MKYRIFTIGLVAALLAACSVNEMDINTPSGENEEFYATIEDASSRVYVDDDLMVLWHADDRVSIFNKYTYNQEYRFSGETGANSGSFKKVPNDDFITGNALNYVYAVYPYQESTAISNQGVLSINLPATQSYAENSFGIGANTMVSCSEGNELLFKNLCGYLMLKLYGDNVAVKSISLKGNNNEPLAGLATVNASVNAAPTLSFGSSATKEITLSFDAPVTLGSTPETATIFWLVVPPTTFSKGFTLTVKDNKNGEFEKSTTKSFQISRNTLSRMSALEVVPQAPEPSDDAIVFADQKLKERLVAKFDANGDGELSYKEAAAVTSIEGAVTIKTITSFDEFQYFTGVTIIPDSYFKDWSKLTSITLPVSIISIENNAFQNCSSLSSICIPDNVTSIGQGAFQNCSTLSSFDMPNSVTNLGINVFQDCSALIDITYSNSLGAIPNYTFNNCSNLTNFIIPDGITSIGSHAFDGCTALQSIIIPEGMKYIYSFAFSGCANLESLFIPKTVEYIEIVQHIRIDNYVTPFAGCSGLMDIVVDPENPVYDSRDNCNALIVTNKNNLIVGSNNATIPYGVNSIHQNAFEGRSKLKSISIPESVTTIGKLAFYGCSSLTSITIPESITTIEYSTFYGCSSLQSLTISDSVTSIEQGAFECCSSLSSIMIPGSVSYIGERAFAGCIGLKTLIISDGVTQICTDAFTGCNALTSVFIPDSVTKIGERAFRLCLSLTSITIPGSITDLGVRVFEGCSSLVSAIIQEGVIYSGAGTFTDCTSLKNVELPESIKNIGGELFAGCSSLNSIVIPEGVETIDSYSFKNCTSLEYIIISSSVTLIGYAAFQNCSRLTSVVCEPILPPSGRAFMFESTNNCPIYVPIESLEAYKTAQYWRDYASRIQAIPSVPVPETVDMGLSVKWASFNLGASKPEEYGYYYAWGELEPYYSLETGKWKEGKESGYWWTSYKWSMGEANTMTKYCNNSSYGFEGFIDDKIILDIEDDAAHVNLGGSWRMPTYTEWDELRENCTWTWTTQNGKKGRLVTGPNGNSIFLPAAGFRYETNFNVVGTIGYYWSSSLSLGRPNNALLMCFYSGSVTIGDGSNRFSGFSIRPVYAE